MLTSFNSFAHKSSKIHEHKGVATHRSSYVIEKPSYIINKHSYIAGSDNYVSRVVALGSWGPPNILFKKMYLPDNEKANWLVMIAKYFVGVPYKNQHNPNIGIDCSSFTSFIYNYALGIHISAGVTRQAELIKKKIYDLKKLKKGDLLFFKRPYKELYHVAIYIDENNLIDSTSNHKTGGVQVRAFTGWYKENFAFGGRIIN